MLKIKIETDNAAFESAPHDELHRIVQQCAAILETHIFDSYERPLHDINGNRVGWIKWEID